jgi:hypothetical protein
MAQVRDGSMTLIRQLVERYQRSLLNFFAGWALSHCEDLAQVPVFLQLLPNKYKPVAKFTTFLYNLARTRVWFPPAANPVPVVFER